MVRKIIISVGMVCIWMEGFGQNDLSNFNGRIVLKETKFYQPIDRYVVDNFISYYYYDIEKNIEIRQLFDNFFDDLDNKYFLQFHMKKINDTLFLFYNDPIDNETDTICQYSLNKKDTIIGNKSYILYVSNDSIYSFKSHTKELTKVVNFRDDDTHYNVYKCDKKIKFKNYKMDCYLIEKTYYKSNGNKILIKQYIDKNLLIPVYEIEYRYYARLRFNRNTIPRNKWIVTREMKIVNID